MTIEKIRNSFSKAHMMISKTGITVLYPHSIGWFGQSIDANVFFDLVRGSNSITISGDGKSFIKIVFSIDIKTDENLVFLSTYKEPSLEEIQQICAGRDCLLDWSEDMSEDEKWNTFCEFLLSREELDPDVEHDMGNWAYLETLVPRLAVYMDAEAEIFLPQDKSEGSATVCIDYLGKNDLVLCGNDKTLLENCISNSSQIGIEGAASCGTLEITFFE